MPLSAPILIQRGFIPNKLVVFPCTKKNVFSMIFLGRKFSSGTHYFWFYFLLDNVFLLTVLVMTVLSQSLLQCTRAGASTVERRTSPVPLAIPIQLSFSSTTLSQNELVYIFHFFAFYSHTVMVHLLPFSRDTTLSEVKISVRVAFKCCG